jgi:hypothetical protein
VRAVLTSDRRRFRHRFVESPWLLVGDLVVVDSPGHNVSAPYVHYQVEMKKSPPDHSWEVCDAPTPDLIGSHRATERDRASYFGAKHGRRRALTPT